MTSPEVHNLGLDEIKAELARLPHKGNQRELDGRIRTSGWDIAASSAWSGLLASTTENLLDLAQGVARIALIEHGEVSEDEPRHSR